MHIMGTLSRPASSWTFYFPAEVASSRVSSRIVKIHASFPVALIRSTTRTSSFSLRRAGSGRKSLKPAQASTNDESSPKFAAPMSKDDESTKPAVLNGSAASSEATVTITVVGASGHLAKKKIFPALFALYYEGCLPKPKSCRVFTRCVSSLASSKVGWTRVIVKKPFGRDSESSAELTRGLKTYLKEDQIFRIDRYPGKELVENLSVLRFSNLVFEPLWSRQFIRNVQLIFSEDFGVEGRGGYFDNYDIIRDMMQIIFRSF